MSTPSQYRYSGSYASCTKAAQSATSYTAYGVRGGKTAHHDEGEVAADGDVSNDKAGRLNGDTQLDRHALGCFGVLRPEVAVVRLRLLDEVVHQSQRQANGDDHDDGKREPLHQSVIRVFAPVDNNAWSGQDAIGERRNERYCTHRTASSNSSTESVGFICLQMNDAKAMMQMVG